MHSVRFRFRLRPGDHPMKPTFLVGLSIFLLACGGEVASTKDGGSHADAASTTDSGTIDGGYCSTSSGVMICGGVHNCGADCKMCEPSLNPNALRICDLRIDEYGGTYQCPDGYLFAFLDTAASSKGGLGYCVHEDVARLYALNGHPEFANYADRTIYFGAPIPPAPTTCPALASGLKLCGGACGACAAKEVCLGRSPQHPYSLCVDQAGSQPGDPHGCQRGTGGACSLSGQNRECMTFLVDAASQPTADSNSMCVAPSICEAAQKDYPGGVICTPGQL